MVYLSMFIVLMFLFTVATRNEKEFTRTTYTVCSVILSAGLTLAVFLLETLTIALGNLF